MLHSLGPFIGHQHGPSPAGWAQLQGTGGAPGIPAGSHPQPAFIGAGQRAPGHPHPLGGGLPQGLAVGGHQYGHPSSSEGGQMGGDGLGFTGSHCGAQDHQRRHSRGRDRGGISQIGPGRGDHICRALQGQHGPRAGGS